MPGHDTRQLTIAVAVPTYGRDRVLVETLEQVIAQSPAPDEVIVVDQTPVHDESTARFLEENARLGRLRWIRQEQPNLPKARNRALAETQCDVVLFIDDDVLLTPGFVEAHLANYRDASVAAVAGRVIQANGWATPSCRRPWPPLLDHRYFRLDGLERRRGVANFGGGNHSVRRAAMQVIGGYDENYIGWAYREDSDAAMRLWKAGMDIVFDPSASLVHLAAPAGGCRIGGRSVKRPEWTVSFPAHYFAFRHLFPGQVFWSDTLVMNVRKYVLRRTNVLRPWRLPGAACAYARSVAMAACRHRAATATERSPARDGES